MIASVVNTTSGHSWNRRLGGCEDVVVIASLRSMIPPADPVRTCVSRAGRCGRRSGGRHARRPGSQRAGAPATCRSRSVRRRLSSAARLLPCGPANRMFGRQPAGSAKPGTVSTAAASSRASGGRAAPRSGTPPRTPGCARDAPRMARAARLARSAHSVALVPAEVALRHHALRGVVPRRAERAGHLAVSAPDAPRLVVDHDAVRTFLVRARRACRDTRRLLAVMARHREEVRRAARPPPEVQRQHTAPRVVRRPAVLEAARQHARPAADAAAEVEQEAAALRVWRLRPTLGFRPRLRRVTLAPTDRVRPTDQRQFRLTA